MKKTNKIGLIVSVLLFLGVGIAFAGEKTGTVMMKTNSADKKNRMVVKIYVDSSGDGFTDTMLSFQIQESKETK